MIGTSLNHYQVTAKLGAGGMGEVFLARDTRLERQVAFKVYKQISSRTGRAIIRGKREHLDCTEIFWSVKFNHACA